MDQKPQIRWDEATQSVVELAPVAVSRDKYLADLEAAQIELNGVEAEEKDLTEKRTVAAAAVAELDKALEAVGARVEDAKSKVDVQAARVEAYDEVVRLRGEQSQPGPSDEATATAGGPVAGQPTAEDVADSLGLEPATDEPEATSEQQEVPIRRRSPL